MFYHPIVAQMLAAEHRADLERKLRHLALRRDLEARPQRRRVGRHHQNE